MRREVSQRELADIVGLTPRQIANLELQGLPARSEGRKKLYQLPDAVQWIRNRAVETAVAKSKPTDYDELRKRGQLAEVEMAELALAEKKRALVGMDVWEREFGEHLAQIRAACLALPGRIAAELPLPPVESVEIIERVVHDVMSEVSEEPAEEQADAA